MAMPKGHGFSLFGRVPWGALFLALERAAGSSVARRATTISNLIKSQPPGIVECLMGTPKVFICEMVAALYM